MRNALPSGDKYTPDDVDIVSKETVFKGFFEWCSFASSINVLKAAGVQ